MPGLGYDNGKVERSTDEIERQGLRSIIEIFSEWTHACLGSAALGHVAFCISGVLPMLPLFVLPL
jgi:hypothetical protein